MLEWIASSSVLILAVAVLRRVLRGRISPRLQYALWLIVLLRLLVPLNIGEAKVSVQNVVHEADTKIASQVVTYVNYELPDLAVPEPDPAQPEAEREAQYEQNAAEYEAQIEAAKAETGTPVTLSDILRYVWYGGMAAMALWFIVTNLVFRARLRRGRQRLEYACKLPVYVTDAVETPCLFGSAIYVTREAAADAMTLRHSVEHELTHRRHGDHVWAILRCACLVLHWYNPLVWLAAMLSRRDAELACDEATIRRLGEDERAAYGRTLIGISCEKRATLLRTATTMNCGRAGLKERILLIAKKPKTAVYAVVILILAAIAAMGCTFTGARETEPEPGPGLKGARTAYIESTRQDAQRAWRYDIEGAELERLTAALEGMELVSEAEEPVYDEENSRYVEPATLYSVSVLCGGEDGSVLSYEFLEDNVVILPGKLIYTFAPESLDYALFDELMAARTPVTKPESDIEAAKAALERYIEAEGFGLVSLAYQPETDEYWTDAALHDSRLLRREGLDEYDFITLIAVLTPGEETVFIMQRSGGSWDVLNWNQPGGGEIWSEEPAEDRVSLGVALTGRSPEDCAWYTPEAQDEWRALLDEAMAAARYGTHVSEGAYLLGQRITDGGRELYFNTDGSLCSLDENFLISAADAAPLRELADETLRSLGILGHVEPADIHGLRSASFTFFGGTATLTDEAELAEIERILSASTSTYPSQCGFASVMRLELEDGRVLSLGMAGDGCGVWQSNGWFYSYAGDNFDLYSLFAAQLIHDLDEETLFGGYYSGGLLKYLDWQRYCSEFGYDACFELMYMLFERAKTDYSGMADILNDPHGLDGALTERYEALLIELQNSAAEPWPEFAAGPAEGGYEFSSAELGLTFTVPAEVSEKVAVASGVRYYDPDGTGLTLYYVPENGRYPITMLYLVAESPRADFFRPGSWYYSASANKPVAAMGEDTVYFTMGPLGGSEIGRDDPLWDDYTATLTAVSAAVRESIAVADASPIPALDTAAATAAAKELAARGGDTLTRAEAAQLAFGLLSASDKAQEYPLNYTDVTPGGEAAQAVAYLDSYGLLRRYSREGEDLDGRSFRPDESITRAEFVTLLHRLSFSPFPLAYGDMPDGIDSGHWACAYLNYAWKCGWLELSGGDIRADEPITCAEAAHALDRVAESGWPTPGLQS